MPPPPQIYDIKEQLLPRPSEASGEGGPPAQKTPIGPIVGIVIIVALLILGALYFWGAHLNARDNPENNLPLILGNDSAPVQ
ncbi:MAG: hypothetical protein Q7R90_02275 [bacterium]|nr:hypothetical protein [bacterium]